MSFLDSKKLLHNTFEVLIAHPCHIQIHADKLQRPNYAMLLICKTHL